jgi:hypothetical protein
VIYHVSVGAGLVALFIMALLVAAQQVVFPVDHSHKRARWRVFLGGTHVICEQTRARALEALAAASDGVFPARAVTLAALLVRASPPSNGTGAFVGTFFAAMLFGGVAVLLMDARLRFLNVEPFVAHHLAGGTSVLKTFYKYACLSCRVVMSWRARLLTCARVQGALLHAVLRRSRGASGIVVVKRAG